MKKTLAILAILILGYTSLVLIVMIPNFAQISDSTSDYIALTMMGLVAILGGYLIRIIWKKYIRGEL